MRVALVHDWLNGMRGGERCLEHIAALFPGADLYTLFHVPGATSRALDPSCRFVGLVEGAIGSSIGVVCQ